MTKMMRILIIDLLLGSEELILKIKKRKDSCIQLLFRKPVTMISGASHITLRIVTGARFFVLKKIYEYRNVKLLKGMRFVAERGCC